MLGSAFVGLRGLQICSISMRPASDFGCVPSALLASAKERGMPLLAALTAVQTVCLMLMCGKPIFFPATPLSTVRSKAALCARTSPPSAMCLHRSCGSGMPGTHCRGSSSSKA